MTAKKEFKYFSIFNHEDEQEYLRTQHKQGWKLVKVTGFGMYHFESCKPEDVIYQLDFNQDQSKDEYIQMFEDCGWEYILTYADYTYFRKVASESLNEEIFCDEASRLQMLERVYKGRLLPLLVIFSACIMPQFVINFSAGRYVIATFMGAICAVYVTFFAYCAYHYNRKKNK